MLVKDDDYLTQCKEVGSLGATIPTFIRNVCRIRLDGTHIGVMDEQRKIVLRRVNRYTDKYQFCQFYSDILTANTAQDIYGVISELLSEYEHPKRLQVLGFRCKACDCSYSPKIACLSCKMPKYVMDVLEAGLKK